MSNEIASSEQIEKAIQKAINKITTIHFTWKIKPT
jgi:hypothetical protein